MNKVVFNNLILFSTIIPLFLNRITHFLDISGDVIESAIYVINSFLIHVGKAVSHNNMCKSQADDLEATSFELVS